MFAYGVAYQKHGREEGAAGHDLVLRTIEKTTGGDVSPWAVFQKVLDQNATSDSE